MKYRKVFASVFFIMVFMLCAGCSSVKIAGRSIENPLDKLLYDLSKGSTTSQVTRWQKEIADPGIKIYDEFLGHYRGIVKAGEKDQLKIAKQLQGEARDKSAKIRELRKKLDGIDAIKLTDEYLYYTRLMLDRMAERLECIDKQASAKNNNEISKYRNTGWHLEGRLVWEARFASDNAASVLLDGRSKHNFYAAGSIKKGHSYETVMHILRMPGEWLPVIKEKQGNKTITHQQAIWVDGQQMVYVDFVDGKAVSWKFVRTHNGFLNKK